MDPVSRVVERARDRPQRIRCHIGMRCDRVLPHRREVGLLKRTLVLHPCAPGLLERHPEDLAELCGVVGAAVLAARDPFDQLLGRMAARQPGHEPRAVEIGVRLHLKVDLRAFGDESQRVVERHVIANHRAEDHLVVAALRASHAAGHPRVDEHRDALVIPPRRGDARSREVPVENRRRVIGRGRDLAAKQSAEGAIGSRRLIHRDDVNQLVVHQHRHPLVRRDGLEGEVERRDLERHDVARDRPGRRVAGVGEIREQHRDRIGQRELEEFLLELQRVQEGARGVGHQVAFGPLEVDEAHLRRFDGCELRVRAAGCGERREEDERGRDAEDQPVAHRPQRRCRMSHGVAGGGYDGQLPTSNSQPPKDFRRRAA